MSERKYLDGQIVVIDKFWTTEGGGQLLPGEPMEAVVISANNTPTLGWVYKLKASIPLHICYNEEDISGCVVFENDPEAIWKLFGDQ